MDGIFGKGQGKKKKVTKKPSSNEDMQRNQPKNVSTKPSSAPVKKTKAPSAKKARTENPMNVKPVHHDEVEEEEEEEGEEPELPEVDPSVHWNPMLECYRLWNKQVPKEMSRIFDPSLKASTREELLNILPSRASRKYAWAIPDERAIKILHHFSPIVEIGAGKGYWGYLLQKYATMLESIDMPTTSPSEVYMGFDSLPSPTAEELAVIQSKTSDDGNFKKRRRGKKGKKNVDEYPSWCKIKRGGPSLLTAFPSHTLFLCYPDDFEQSEDSMAAECLEHFSGDTVILVGESLGQTLIENPWGKSVDGSFQLQLGATFHKVLQVPLPSWPGSFDTLTVWKRTQRCAIDEDMEFKYVPPEEMIEMTAAAPSTKGLLNVQPIDQLLKKAKKN